jgi:branched-chain amino acid transport system substrate-binding protein
MKRPLVKLVSALAVGSLLLTTACSSSSKSAGSSSGSSSGGGSTSGEFRIASPIDRTGSDAGIGTFWSAGLDAAVKKVNGDGGILGRKVVVDYKDTQSNPQTATQVTDAMLSTGKYQALIPTASGAQSLPILQVVNKYKILTAGTGPLLDMGDPTKYPTVFNDNFSPTDQGKAVGCLTLSFKPKKVAFLYIDDPLPVAEVGVMTPMFKSAGIDVVADEKYDFAATDISAQVQKIAGAKPDVIVVMAYFNALSTAIKALDAAGLGKTVQMVGDADTSAAPPATFLAAGTDLPAKLSSMQWQINARTGDDLSPAQKQASDAVTDAIGGKFSVALSTYLYPYDALLMIKWAAEKAKSDKSADMVKAMETMGSDTGPGPGTLIVPKPPYSPTNHQSTGPMFVVDIAGKVVSGTFPASGPIPSC